MIDCSHGRVLVVDDDPGIRTSLASFLEDYDFKTMAAQNAEEALELLTNESFDMAIVDLRLPGMNGEAFVLRAHELLPELRFLIYTGSVSYCLSDELVQIGLRPEHVVRKPLTDLSVLLECIEDVLQRKDQSNER